MEVKQRSKLGMGMTTRDYLSPHAAITTPLPNYTKNYTIVRETIPQIEAFAEQQDFDITGIRENKDQLRNTLLNLAADCSRKLTAFAKFTNNTVLLREIKVSETELKRFADINLKTSAQEFCDRAQVNLESLDTYGITADTQAALLNAINVFNTSIPKPRLGIEERKQATLQLAVLFSTLDTALENIDTAIEIVKNTQPAFYSGYKDARRIINTGKGSLAVKGLVTDAASGEPLRGATITFCPECAEPTMQAAANGMSNAKEEVVLTKISADKGGFNIKSIPEGVYRVTVKKNGYKEQVVKVAITNGEMEELDIGLSKN